VLSLLACERKAHKTDAPPPYTQAQAEPGTLGAALPPSPAISAPAPRIAALHLFGSEGEFKTACMITLADIRARLAAIASYTGPASIDGVYKPYNEMMLELQNSWQEAAFWEDAHPKKEIREAAEECDQSFSKTATDISLSRPLYDVIAKVDVSQADARARFSVFKTLRDFRRAGVDRDAATRAKISDMTDKIVRAGQSFERVVRDDIRHIEVGPSKLAGLPPDYIAAHRPGKNGKIVITTRDVDYVPFMAYAQDDAARKALRLMERTRGFPTNESNLKALLAARYKLAKLLGYPDYASYTTEVNMVGTPDNAQKFLDEINSIVKPAQARDLSVLLDRLRELNPKAERVAAWQYWYLTNLVRKEKYSVDARELRNYFQFANVTAGILKLTEDQFGLEIKDWNTPVWDPHVTAHEVYAGTKLIGRFYLDLHPRDGKAGGAAQYAIAVGIEGEQVPIDVLLCNFPGAEDPSALMEHDDVVTFFHEFGHLLHDLLAGHGDWVNNAGITTELDFSEAPSQLRESWAHDYGTLKRFAVNARGETIPEGLVEALNRARFFALGVDTATQLYYASVALDFYHHDPSTFDLQAEDAKLEAAYSPFPPMAGAHFYDSFDHLNDYSANYYTYQWSLAIAQDLFTRFQKRGLLDQNVNLVYRKSILEPGSSAPAADLIENFLGRPWSTAAYRNWLNRTE
jgi:thimet oligopeptidase